MRLLWVGKAPTAGDRRPFEPHDETLGPGMKIRTVVSSDGRFAEAKLVARSTAEALRFRPEVAHVRLTESALSVPPSLAAAGVPVVVEVPEPFLAPSGSPLRDALRLERFRAAARSARSIVVPDPTVAQHLQERAGIRGVAIEPQGALDLALWPTIDVAEARRELGLHPEQRWFALVAPLEARLRLDLLGLAQRRIPGAGLLVVGEGPGVEAVVAMSMATRPSSPVQHLEDRSEVRALTVGACDVGLSLGSDEPGPESGVYAAMGRRQVAFDHPALARIEPWYPGEMPVVRASPTEAGLRTAMEEAMNLSREGPLSAAHVERARQGLGAIDRAEWWRGVYASCV